MGPISLETSIDAPRERVFDAINDLAVRTTFTSHFQEDYRLARIESRGGGASARYKVDPPGLGVMWVETVISESVRPLKVAERGRAGRLGRVSVFTSWEILEGARLTEVRLTFRTEAPLPDRAREMLGAGRWYRRHWKKALRNLTEAVEGDAKLEKVDVAGGDRAWTGVF